MGLVEKDIVPFIVFGKTGHAIHSQGLLRTDFPMHHPKATKSHFLLYKGSRDVATAYPR
jgi:hypothetical protein